jgi:hypothetical protein
VRLNGAYFKGEEEWAVYLAYLETPEQFLLYVAPQFWRIIPKRALGDSVAIEEFRKLLATKIGKIRRGWFR